MDSGKWTTQGIGEVNSSIMAERKVRPERERALNCPRCNSTNTKFCYYNNYSLTQPRYLCKTCRRYWTEGGTLRNVPVGGGSRKHKRYSSSSSSSSSTATTPVAAPSSSQTRNFSNPNNPSSNSQIFPPPSQNPNHPINFSQFLEFPKVDQIIDSSSMMTTTSGSYSTLELLKTGGIESRDMNSFTAEPICNNSMNNPALYTSSGGGGFSYQELKPSLGFSFEDVGRRYDNDPNGVQENVAGKVVFPFGANVMKQHPSTKEVETGHHQGNSSGYYYWNGMLGGESW